MNHCLLDLPAHHAAAQEKVHDLRACAAGLQAHEARQSGIAQLVRDAEDPHALARLRRPRLQFRLGQPPRGEIQLIRLVQQLRGAREVRGVEFLDRDLDVQTLEPFVERAGLAFEVRALPIRDVALGARGILRAEHRRVEAAQAEQGALVEHRVLRPLRHEHLGQGLAHARALNGIVVEEHDGLQAEVQLRRQLDEVRGLVLPVDAPAGEVLDPELHLGMPPDGFERDGLLVLADDAEHEAAARESLERALEIREGLPHAVVTAELQVLPAHVADDAAPQRVIEVHDDELARRALQAANGGLHVLHGLLKDGVGERDFPLIPELRAERARARAHGPALRVEQEDVRRRRDRLRESEVHLQQRVGQAAVGLKIRHAETSLAAIEQPCRDEQRLHPRRRALQQRGELVHRSEELCRGGGLEIQPALESGDHLFRLRPHNRELGLLRPAGVVRIGKRGDDLAEGRLDEFERGGFLVVLQIAGEV